MNSNNLNGGVGDYAESESVDPTQLSLGIQIEMEHTNDLNVAKKIAMHHLQSDSIYYTKLVKAGLSHEFGPSATSGLGDPDMGFNDAPRVGSKGLQKNNSMGGKIGGTSTGRVDGRHTDPIINKIIDVDFETSGDQSTPECISGNNCKCGCNIVNESKIKSYIKKCISEILGEKLLLKRGENDIVVVSDKEDRREAGNETFRHKNALKKAGFNWNSTLNSWTISKDKFGHAQQILSTINGNPLEKLIDAIEELPEFVLDSDNISRKQELSTKIDEFIEKLSDAVDGSSVSAEVIQFLNFNKHFRTYSFCNTILIYLQNRNATKVAGFNKWKLLHRIVKKGAKAITIFAPITRKDVDDIKDAGLDAAVKTKNTVYFRPVSVFDISDTEAIDERGNLPTQPSWHDNNTPSEVADKIYKYVSEFAETTGIKLTHDSARGGEMGWAQSDHINLSSAISGVNKLSTLIHEIAHSLLHFKSSSIFFGDDGTKNITSAQRELQAESVSYVVMRNYNLPVEHQSTYLALWGANKASVKDNLQTIKKAANFIIDGIDDVAKEHESKNQLTELLKNLIHDVIRESKSVKKKN